MSPLPVSAANTRKSDGRIPSLAKLDYAIDIFSNKVHLSNQNTDHFYYNQVASFISRGRENNSRQQQQQNNDVLYRDVK
jgi:hypothetical protein